MERTLRVSLNTCPLHKISEKKNQKHLIPKVEKIPPINTIYLDQSKRAT